MNSPSNVGSATTNTFQQRYSLELDNAVEISNPTWRKVFACLPVICVFMQIANDRWMNAQEPQATDEKKLELLNIGLCHEKCAFAGHLLTTIGLVALAVLASNPLSLIAIGGVFVFGMVLAQLTVARIDIYKDRIRDL